MSDAFLKLLNMSLTASWLVLAVVILRFVFKKAPKWINCILWGIVGLKLIMPFSLESVLSLIPSSEPIPQNIAYQPIPSINTGIPIINNTVNPVIKENFTPQISDSVNPLQVVIEIASVVWLVGIGIMFIYSVISYLRLYHKVKVSLNYKENIYYCDNISSPFILGIIKPKIYIPSGIDAYQTEFIIKHEKAHLKRLDHFWKPLSFLLLSVYWFNPFLWVAYILLCRDIELACDEKVIKNMDIQSKKDYSTTLAECGNQRRMIMVCPLAFGEVGVKDRIKSVLNYKKPAFWIILVAVIISIVLAVCFLTNPQKATLDNILNENGYKITGQIMEEITLSFPKSSLPEAIYTEGYEFKENEIVVYETETTKIYLEKVTPDNENDGKLYFYFNFSYNIGDGSGTILYPWTKTENGYGSTFNLTKDILDCDNYSYPNAVALRSQGPDNQVALYVDKMFFKSAKGTIKLYVYCNEITYSAVGEESHDIPMKNDLDTQMAYFYDDTLYVNFDGAKWYYNCRFDYYFDYEIDEELFTFKENEKGKTICWTAYSIKDIPKENRIILKDDSNRRYVCVRSMGYEPDTQTIYSLRLKYPEYFNLPTEDGLNLYIFMESRGVKYCKLTSGDKYNSSALPYTTFGEMQMILNQKYNQKGVSVRVYFELLSNSSISPNNMNYTLYDINTIKTVFGIHNCNIEYNTPLEQIFYKETYPTISEIVDETKRGNICTDLMIELFYEDTYNTYHFSSMKSQYIKVIFKDGREMSISDALLSGHIPVMALNEWDIDYGVQEKSEGLEYFTGTIVEVKDNSILVKTFDDEWESFYTVIELPKKTANTDEYTRFKVGMTVEVEYKGAMLDTEPPIPSNTIAIYILNN